MVKKNKIIVIPFAGLGNRMRVLSSCIKIAKEQGRTLSIVWPKNSALNCNLADIFETVGMAYSVPPLWIHFILRQIYRHGAIKRLYSLYKPLSNLVFDNSIFDNDTEFSEPEIDSNDSIILVATCFAFGGPQDFKSFKFTDYLTNETIKQYQKFAQPYIGIHIRRTDHVELIKHSPLESYIAYIDKYLQVDPSQKFFLATDDAETKKCLIQKYKNSFYTYDHDLGRTTVEGVHGAVIELLLLSKSRKIICSELSSYSDTAIIIGNIREVIYVESKQ